jgi:hypothetical protein
MFSGIFYQGLPYDLLLGNAWRESLAFKKLASVMSLVRTRNKIS